jgi:hypothetical protein
VKHESGHANAGEPASWVLYCIYPIHQSSTLCPASWVLYCVSPIHQSSTGLFVWLVADGWCWFVLREKYCWLVAGGWFVLREKYCWLVADKPSEQAFQHPIRLAYQPPVSSIFLSEHISHQQPDKQTCYSLYFLRIYIYSKLEVRLHGKIRRTIDPSQITNTKSSRTASSCH